MAFTGHEKAQISRAVKALEGMGLIERASLRAKLVLRAPGEKIFQTIATISLKRDAALTAGFSTQERNRFCAMTQALTVRAAQIYARERQLSAEAAAAGQGAAAAVPSRLSTMRRTGPTCPS